MTGPSASPAAPSGLRPAVIVGNGPSLRGYDMKRLQAYDSFGMNAAYRHWDDIESSPLSCFLAGTLCSV